MKVLIISTVGLIYDGITSVIVSCLEAMERDGLDIYVAATGDSQENIRRRIEAMGCTIVDFPDRRKHTLAYALALTRWIRRNRIQAVHAHGNSGTLAIEMCAAWLGGCRKRIAHSHNTRCDQVKADKLLRPVFNRFYTDALACGDAAGRWLFGDRPFTVLINGRDTALFAYDADKRRAMREELQLGDALTIGHVGGFFEQKNHRFLMDIYRAILRREPDAKLFCIGDGPLRGEIEEAAADMGNGVIFTGTTDRVADYLQAMDGMLLPSLFEGLPLVAVEWQINGLPCLMADTVTAECALTDTAAFLSLTDSSDVWAEKIIAMARGNDRAASAAKGAEQVRAAGFDVRDSARMLKALYLGQQ